MSTHNIEDIANNIIHNTLETIEKNLDKLIGDMDLMCALKFVDAVMDLRDRQYTYIHTAQNRINDCVKKPKRSKTDGL